MTNILHITARSHWQQALQLGLYRPDSLETEGFIHCSAPEQVAAAANRFFRGQTALVLLHIDPLQLQSELRYDRIETGEVFPHIYGPLNLEAVVQVHDFAANAAGLFIYP